MTDDRVSRLPSLDAADIAVPEAGELIVVMMESTIGTPWWQQLLAEELDAPDLALGPLPSRGVVVFCAVEDPTCTESVRWLAWPFGIGSRYLARKKLEPRFGVIAALNRIIHEGAEHALLRKLQYRAQGAYRQRVGHVASTDTPLAGFRIDEVRDILSAAGGKPAGDEAQVFGGRNLVFRTEVDNLLSTVIVESSLAIASYRDDRYKRHFGFIDNFIQIDDDSLGDELTDALEEDIVNARDTVDFVYPDDLVDFNDERAVEFILFPKEHVSSASRKVLTIDSVRHLVSKLGAEALETELRFLDGNHELLGRAELLECLSAEIQLDDERYYLGDGNFYHVQGEFIDRIDTNLESVPSCEIEFPLYEGEREDEWIRRAAEHATLGVLDGKLISLSGRSSFEATDLIHRNGSLIHVKRKGRSSALSYLFVQASISSQMLSEVPDAAVELRALVRSHVPAEIQEECLDALKALDESRSNLDVVLAILGDWDRKSIRSLPLIAKLELDATVRAIGQRGFHPQIALVPLGSRA